MNKAMAGFTLIEVLAFLIVTSLLMSTFLLGVRTVSMKSPLINNQKIALQTARACMEWFLGQRNLNGYNTYSCPSTPTSSNCAVPSGFTVTTNITCTTWNSDTNYKTLTITVSGLANASLSTLLGSY